MSAYKRPDRDNHWWYRRVIKLPSGKRERIHGPAPVNTKAAAEQAERAHIERLLNPPPIEAPPPVAIDLIRDYAVTFMSHYLPSQKPSERRSKEQILEAHLLPVFGDRRLDEVRQEHVDAFSAAELKRGCAVKTVNNRLGVLSSLLGYAADNLIIPRPSLRFTLSGMRGEMVAVSAEDLEKLLAVATDDRYRAAVLLAAEAGLRAGEVLGLQFGDIRDGQLTVRRALDKDTGEVIAPKHDKARQVPLSPRLVTSLESLKRRGLWVISRLDGDPLGYHGLLEPILALYKAAGVEKPPKPIHALRHHFGTECANRGMPLAVLKDLMGHADIKTTLLYCHVNERQKRAAVAAVFPSQGRETPKDATEAAT